MFSARKLITLNWLNDQDEYLKPNQAHEKYNTFKNMSIVKSIFSEGSNQTSWLNKEYKGTNYRVKNEFFPFTKQQIQNKLNDNAHIQIFNDFTSSDDRFLSNLLYKYDVFNDLPEICKNILREYFKIYTKYVGQISNEGWDIGYVQIKKFMSEKEKQIFGKLLNELDNQMLPMVYELGFLIK
jgi:hypothetical protein